jgi:hypothetical protein
MVKEFGPLTEGIIRSYTRQMLEGLCFLHRHRIVHRVGMMMMMMMMMGVGVGNGFDEEMVVKIHDPSAPFLPPFPHALSLRTISDSGAAYNDDVPIAAKVSIPGTPLSCADRGARHRFCSSPPGHQAAEHPDRQGARQAGGLWREIPFIMYR